MNPESTAEHRWLQQLLGEWTFEGAFHMPPDDNNEARTSGTQSFRPLGVWVMGTMAEPPGGANDESVISLAFDSEKGRFVGTFLSSMSTHIWLYEGDLDAGANSLVLNADGPSMDGTPGTQHYQDIIDISGPASYVMRSRVETPDGWVEFMRLTFTRAA
ncbi:MAG: DUF1579 domain-containing protein [Dehalococcoidia bacterium]